MKRAHYALVKSRLLFEIGKLARAAVCQIDAYEGHGLEALRIKSGFWRDVIFVVDKDGRTYTATSDCRRPPAWREILLGAKCAGLL